MLDLKRTLSWTQSELVQVPGVRRALDHLERPQWRDGILCLTGPQGSGKTHLAHLWASRVSAEMLTSDADLARAVQSDDPALLLEDASRYADQESFFHLLNQCAAGQRTLLMTDRRRPLTWETSIPDLTSRLKSMDLLELDPPDDEILSCLLLREFQLRSIRPPEDLIPYLVTRMERTGQAAQKIVTALDMVASDRRVGVSRTLAREILENQASELFDGH
jgi:chromosomal replication initiation ATPase DnaA